MLPFFVVLGFLGFDLFLRACVVRCVCGATFGLGVFTFFVTWVWATSSQASVGGALSAFFVTPLDVVKARLQAQQRYPLPLNPIVVSNVGVGGFGTSAAAAPQQLPRLLSTVDGLVRIAKVEGVTSLWRGLQPTLVMAIPASAMYFTIYDSLKTQLRSQWLGQDDGRGLILAPMIAGLGARVVTSTTFSPLEMARTFLQASSTSALSEVSTAVRSGGVGVLWRGLVPTLWRDAPFSAIYWALYEWTKHRVITPRVNASYTFHEGQQLAPAKPFVIDFLSGASSGMIAALVTTPLDVVKTLMQMSVESRRAGMMSILREIYANYGMRGLFAGAVPRTVRAAPSCAIMISSYEVCMRYFRQADR